MRVRPIVVVYLMSLPAYAFAYACVRHVYTAEAMRTRGGKIRVRLPNMSGVCACVFMFVFAVASVVVRCGAYGRSLTSPAFDRIGRLSDIARSSQH